MKLFNKPMYILLLLFVGLLFSGTLFAETSPILVKHDKRIELAWAVFILTSSGSECQKSFIYPYRKPFLDDFQEFKEHQAIKTAEKLIQGEWYHFPSDVVDIPLYHSDPPELKKIYEYPQMLDSRLESHENAQNELESFIIALKNFYIDSDFEQYWQEHLSEYDEVVSSIENISSEISINILENYYGLPVKMKFIVVPSLLTPAGYGFGPSVEPETAAYFIVSPKPVSADSTTFSVSKEWLEALAFHEFGHSFINPLTEEFIDEVNKRDSLFEYLNEDSLMIKMYYGKWDICLNEHLVEVVKARIKLLRGDEETALKHIEGRERQGFRLSQVLYYKLEQYEKNRGKYPTFRDFYLELLSVLDSLRITKKQMPIFAFSCAREKDGHPEVTFVSYGTESQKAELKRGDLVLSIDGHNVKSFMEIEEMRKVKPIGSIVNILVLRDNEEKYISYTVKGATYYEFEKITPE